MHFIDVGFKNSCSGNIDFYCSESVLYGLTDKEEEVSIITWKTNSNLKVEEIYNENLTAENFMEIVYLVREKQKIGAFSTNFNSVESQIIKRKDYYE